MDLNPILALMEKGQIPFDYCSFLDEDRTDISSLNYFSEKKSASDTLVFFMTVLSKLRLPTALAMKMFIGWDEVPEKDRIEFITKNKTSANPLIKNTVEMFERVRYTYGLEYEAKVYRYITENILFKGESINFIPFVGKASCSLAEISRKVHMSDLDTGEKAKLLPFLNNPLKYFPDLKLKMFVTGSVENKKNLIKLHDLMENSSLSLAEINSIIVQLLHALLVMQRHKIMHNDVHFGNIFVEKVYPLRDVSLKLDDKTTISFKTKYIPKIYDWDRSFCEALGENPVLKSEKYLNMNIHESFRKSQDYYHMVCGFLSRETIKNDTSIYTIFSEILPKHGFTYWYTEEDEKDYKFFIPPKRVQQLQDYVSENNLKTYFSKGKTYYNIPKDIFEKFVILPARIQIDFTPAMKARFDVADTIYFSLKDNEGTLYAGFHCMPIYDIPDTLLYPLETLFSDAKLFDALTKNLKNFEVKEEV